MSIYQQILGKTFYKLHPMLQKRYECMQQQTFIATGIMETIKGGPKWLYPFFLLGTKSKLLFPEHGNNIPFTIVNTPRTGRNGEVQIHWERVFYFKHRKRSFNALMSLDQNKSVIKDYLGEPHRLYADLIFTVTKEGNLRIFSRNQRVIFGRFEMNLPKILQANATVVEKYNESREMFYIEVIVKNRIIGHVFSYKGEFTSDVISSNRSR